MHNVTRRYSRTLFLDNLPLAQKHLVFKFSTIDPQVKCSEIVPSMNVMKVTPRVITSLIIALRDLLPMAGLEIEYLVLHQVIVAGSYHGNSDLLCVKGPEYQPMINEH